MRKTLIISGDIFAMELFGGRAEDCFSYSIKNDCFYVLLSDKELSSINRPVIRNDIPNSISKLKIIKHPFT